MDDAVDLLIRLQGLEADMKDFIIQRVDGFLLQLHLDNLPVKVQLQLAALPFLTDQPVRGGLIRLEGDGIRQVPPKTLPGTRPDCLNRFAFSEKSLFCTVTTFIVLSS